MPEIRIERLVLKAAAMDAHAAKRLAEQVAAGLESAPLAGDLPQRAELVRFEVRAAPGATTDGLTQQILAELMRELRRS
ncbi:MAG TPA: hypothetical protein VKF84_18165 [Candidatus Sulfotelmatobacter sp.]|nr:hypothetical protein [Candidatus Sulfotelmatobacter sp.]